MNISFNSVLCHNHIYTSDFNKVDFIDSIKEFMNEGIKHGCYEQYMHYLTMFNIMTKDAKKEIKMLSSSLLGVENANTNKTAVTMNNGTPNWTYIPSAGRCKKTNEQLISEIKNLANRVAQANNGKETEQLNQAVIKLQADYISDVSPDRKGLYKQAERAIKFQSKNRKGIMHGAGELSLLYFLEYADRSQNLSEKSFSLAGGAMLTFPILTTGGYGVIIERGGVQLLAGDDYGWGYEMTPAELKKKDEFYAIYNSAVKNAQKEIKELRDLPDYLEDKPIFDSLA
ncbi:MAG: hypothetical protein VZR24_14880 [Butyrivibrio hungatei]|nr:hypothetical protein [Butyrivibrio hungatei]